MQVPEILSKLRQINCAQACPIIHLDNLFFHDPNAALPECPVLRLDILPGDKLMQLLMEDRDTPQRSLIEDSSSIILLESSDDAVFAYLLDQSDTAIDGKFLLHTGDSWELIGDLHFDRHSCDHSAIPASHLIEDRFLTEACAKILATLRLWSHHRADCKLWPEAGDREGEFVSHLQVRGFYLFENHRDVTPDEMALITKRQETRLERMATFARVPWVYARIQAQAEAQRKAKAQPEVPTEASSMLRAAAATPVPPAKPKRQRVRRDLSKEEREFREQVKAARAEARNTQNKIIAGYVYVVTNPAWPDLVSLGKTQDKDERLSTYQRNDPFRRYEMQFAQRVNDRSWVEKAVHAHFAPQRHEDTEWFRLSVPDAIAGIERVLRAIDSLNRK